MSLKESDGTPSNESSRSSFSAPRDMKAIMRDGCLVFAVALLARLVVVAWASSRFPPAADGQFYQVVATRISQGLGYTWLWPDGAVTYAAHYPVGYPAILGALYRLFGTSATVAMVLNGLLGAATAWCVHRTVSVRGSRASARFAGLIAALHPTLLFYTPAMMTELVSAALVIFGVTVAALPSPRQRAAFLQMMALGLLCGVGTLVRPQQLLWAPLLGGWFVWQRVKLTTAQLSMSRIAGVFGGAVAVSAVAIACCVPWTLRNCDKMERCVFVSANGGWNLFIGASPKGQGAWASIDSIGVPSECRLVFKEAEKDYCFGNSAKRKILAHPSNWLKLVPSKLEKTFDDVGAPGYYLHASNSAEFGERAKWYLGASEVLVHRSLALLATLSMAFLCGPRRVLRRILGCVAAVSFFLPYAWLGVCLFCVGAALLGRKLLEEWEILMLAVAWAMTALVHSVFFGGARYAIVVMPLVIVASVQVGRLVSRAERLPPETVA